MFLQRGVFSPLSSLTHERPPKASEKRPENQHVNLSPPCFRLGRTMPIVFLWKRRKGKEHGGDEMQYKYTYQLKKNGEAEIWTSISEADNIVTCYYGRIRSYWSRFVSKRLHYWQEDRICQRGNNSHIWPVHSITVRGRLSGLYITTCVLFISLRSMVMWGGGQKMDARGGLIDCSTERQRPPRWGRKIHLLLETNLSWLRFQSLCFSHPSVVARNTDKQKSRIHVSYFNVFITNETCRTGGNFKLFYYWRGSWFWTIVSLLFFFL